MINNMKIVIFGAGYVGLGNALLLAQKHKINLIDIDETKINLINNGQSPIKDSLISNHLKKNKNNITGDSKMSDGIKKSDYCILALPSNFNSKMRSFDTSAIEDTLKKLNSLNYTNHVVIRSTVPIGFCERISKKYKNLKVSFFPEFLREGNALHDSLYPSRIIAGGIKKNTKEFADILQESCKKKQVPILYTSLCEAESIKLLSNTYLAMRIAFFNELDSFALTNKMSSKNIIEGICLDQRIGDYYNNPSFGYGGYCLPKDTMQLSQHFQNVPNKLVKSIDASNELRKKFIFEKIIQGNHKVIGIFRLAMKAESDNSRNSSIIDVINLLQAAGKKLIIYEPSLKEEHFLEIPLESNLNKFLSKVTVVIANRMSDEIANLKIPVFTRDIFNIN